MFTIVCAGGRAPALQECSTQHWRGSVHIGFQDRDGGARRNRTDDLFNAIEALSQLSYGPTLRHWTGAKPDTDFMGKTV